MTITADLSTRPPLRAALQPTVLVALLGPLSVAVLRGILPYFTTDDGATVAASVAAHPDAQSAVLWLSYLALLTLPLGVLITGRAALRARPVLGAVAATVAWLGFGSLFLIIAGDQVALAGTALPPSTTGAMIDAIGALPMVSFAATVFVAGHILGTVLLGVALWRAIPRWAAAALAVSQPLHLLFAVVVPNHLLDAVAWGLTTVGFTAAAMTRADA
jgi:hypothetical protein